MTGNNNQNQQDDLQKKIKDAQQAAKKKEEKNAAQSGSNSTSNSGDDAVTGNTQNNPVGSENSAINNLKQELEQMTELAKRGVADLQNLRRRHEEERRVLITSGNIELISSLLPVLDNLERALKHAPRNTKEIPENGKEWLKGIEMSLSQLKQTLANFGLKPIDSLEQDFNPDLHEAIAQEEGEENKILEELEKGYMLGERVIRHSKVKVGTKMS